MKTTRLPSISNDRVIWYGAVLVPYAVRAWALLSAGGASWWIVAGYPKGAQHAHRPAGAR